MRELRRSKGRSGSAIYFDQTMRDFRSVLPRLNTPCLAAAGAEEKLVTLAGAKDLAARLQVFGNSSHCPFMEEPDDFADAVRRLFLYVKIRFPDWAFAPSPWVLARFNPSKPILWK